MHISCDIVRHPPKLSNILDFIDYCIHKFLRKLFIKRAQDCTTTQKKEITLSLENLGKKSFLAK